MAKKINAAPKAAVMQPKSNAEGNRASLHFANMKNMGANGCLN